MVTPTPEDVLKRLQETDDELRRLLRISHMRCDILEGLLVEIGYKAGLIEAYEDVLAHASLDEAEERWFRQDLEKLRRRP